MNFILFLVHFVKGERGTTPASVHIHVIAYVYLSRLQQLRV